MARAQLSLQAIDTSTALSCAHMALMSDVCALSGIRGMRDKSQGCTILQSLEKSLDQHGIV